MENNQAVLVRRDTHEKTVVSLDELEAKAEELLDTIQHDMLEKARKHRCGADARNAKTRSRK